MSFIPGFWMNETSGVLRPAVEAYLNHHTMTSAQIAAMRAYLRQWMAGEWGPEHEVRQLRETVDNLTTQDGLSKWFTAAIEIGIDPL